MSLRAEESALGASCFRVACARNRTDGLVRTSCGGAGTKSRIGAGREQLMLSRTARSSKGSGRRTIDQGTRDEGRRCCKNKVADEATQARHARSTTAPTARPTRPSQSEGRAMNTKGVEESEAGRGNRFRKVRIHRATPYSLLPPKQSSIEAGQPTSGTRGRYERAQGHRGAGNRPRAKSTELVVLAWMGMRPIAHRDLQTV